MTNKGQKGIKKRARTHGSSPVRFKSKEEQTIAQRQRENKIDKKHEENLKNFKEIKDIYLAHDESDKIFQNEIKNQFERMEPMIKAFEDKKISRMVFQEETRTITFYVTSALKIGALLAGGWAFLKFALNK